MREALRRGTLLVACLGTGCAAGPWLPGLGLHATSIHRQRLTHGPGEQAARSWDLVLWADLSFRLDTAPVREGDAQPAAMPSAFAADSCSVPAACQWERDAIDTALAALPPQGQGNTP